VTVCGWTPELTGLGPLARGFARGLMRNLASMLPASAMKGRSRLVGSGNALRRSALLRRTAVEEFGRPLCIRAATEEAALGAARWAPATDA